MESQYRIAVLTLALPSEPKTPMHIRGKRNSNTTAANIRKSKKRRLSPASWEKLNATHTAAAPIRLSRLELLPVELLEQIFFESLREPPLKAQDLPSYEDDDMKSYWSESLDNLYSECSQTVDDLDSDCSESVNVYSFNSRVIDRYDWSNLLSLPRASPVLGRKLCSHGTKLRLVKLVFFPKLNHLPSNLAKLGFRSTILRLRWMTPAIWKESRPHPFPKPPHRTSHSLKCWFPSKLLRAPWDDEKIDFLRDLRGFGAKINLDDSYDGEIADEALSDAILSKNIKVVRLLSFHDVALRPLRDGGWMQNNPAFQDQDDQQQEFRLAHLSFQARSKHVKLAVMQGGCDPAMVATVLLAVRMNPRVQLLDSFEYESMKTDSRKWMGARQQEGNAAAAVAGRIHQGTCR